MQSSTAEANSDRMLRICSSAFGERRVKCSHASYRMAAGAVDPGRKIENVDAEGVLATDVERADDVPGTFSRKSQVPGPIILTPSISDTV